MPIYEYHCRHCDDRREEIYGCFDDSPPDMRCVCGERTKRIVSSPAFKISGQLAAFDGDPLAGTPLEGSDGVNRTQYKRKRLYSGL